MGRALLRLCDIGSDLRWAVRSCRRQPLFSFTLAGTLALGLGLAAAILSFADGYLFRPSPFPSPDQLYIVRDPHAAVSLLQADTIALRGTHVGHFGFVEWSAGHRIHGSEMIVDGRPVHIFAYDVTPNFGQTLQLPLTAGRMFTDADHRESATVPAWMGYRFWQREFGGDRSVLDRSFRITGDPPVDVTIVGILGREIASFDLNNTPPEIVVPQLVDDPPKPAGRNRLSFPIVRLPGTMSREEGEARISAALQAVAPATDGRPRQVQLRSLHESQVSGGRPTARVLLSAALLVLLLVTINLVHLLLARGVARATETSTRAALGASRARIARLFLVESLLLGVAGIAGGLLLGAWLSKVIAARVPLYPTTGRNLALVPMAFDARIVIATIALGLVISVFGGLWPAWRALRRPLQVSMRGSGGVESRLPVRLSRIVLGSELTVATVLLLGTVFIGQGIWAYLHQPLGFSYADRVTIGIGSAQAGRPAGSARDWETVREAIGTIPGVAAVGAYQLRDGQPVNVGDVPVAKADGYDVGAGYFDAWEVRLAEGRLFSPDEMRTEAPVAIVDAALARRAWPGAPAIGQEVRIGDGPVRRIVGVVETQIRDLQREPMGEAYVPRRPTAGFPRLVAWAPGIRSERLIREVIPIVDRILPGSIVRAEPVTLTWLFYRQTGEAEFQGPIMLSFAILTFLLAGVGVFGLVSYLVAQRTREFGIRLALGARGRDIWHVVMRESIVPAAAGLIAGSALAAGLERVVRASVFGWPSSGAAALTAAGAALLLVAVTAAAGPARRALRIDPSVVLRAE